MVTKTRDKILEVSRMEFLDKGFDGASLREIAQKARITTGAIYGYFKSKDDLFSNLVKEVAEEFLSLQERSHLKYTSSRPDHLTAHSSTAEDSFAEILHLIDYIYDHFDIFKLLICHSAQTSYQSYFYHLVLRHIESSKTMLDLMGLRETFNNLDDEFVEIISYSYLSDIFEMVKRDMPKEKAINYVIQLSSFYGAGWLAMAQANLSNDSSNLL